MQSLDLSVSVQPLVRGTGKRYFLAPSESAILSQPGPVLWVAHAKAGATRPGTAPGTGARELRGRGPANMQCTSTVSTTSLELGVQQCSRPAGWRWNYRDWSGTCMPYAQPRAAMQVCCAVP